MCYLPSAERMVASGVSEVETLDLTCPSLGKREKEGTVLISEGQATGAALWMQSRLLLETEIRKQQEGWFSRTSWDWWGGE